MNGVQAKKVVEGNETTGCVRLVVQGAEGTAEATGTNDIAAVLESSTSNIAAQGSAVENTSGRAEDLDDTPDRTTLPANEEESSKRETTEPPKSVQSWGWNGWGNMLAVVQDAASEVRNSGIPRNVRPGLSILYHEFSANFIRRFTIAFLQCSALSTGCSCCQGSGRCTGWRQ